jgi:KDO2-lipid IV(A) lauroyltransferase
MADATLRKRLRYLIEGAGATTLYTVLGAMPLPWASALGGFVARTIGPRAGASKRARINLRRAMPELDELQIEKIVRGMWENLGRVFAEYPHLGKFQIYGANSRVEVVGYTPRDNPPKAGQTYLFWGGHYGNWEIATLAATQSGLKAAAIYRAANNPIVDRLIRRARSVFGSELIPKGVTGRRAISALRKGAHLCLLIDQKMNTGIPVPFFGRDAMTEKVLARLALRYDCVVIPARVERIAGARFRVTCDPPMEVRRTGDDDADALNLMTQINARLEEWIRQRPEQWFWLHRRWPD